MRKIIRHVFLFFLIPSMLWWWFDPIEYFNSIKLTTLENKRIKENTRNSLTYLLSDSKWLTFSVPTFSDELKFLYTANLDEKERTGIDSIDEDPNIRYSVEYEFLDNTGKVINSKIHHFRTTFILFEDENQSLKQKMFYMDSDLRATMSEILHLELHKSKASKVRMKLHSSDSRVVDIGVRSYHIEKSSEYNQNIIWERLRKDRQDYLSRGNVFSSVYLTQEEKDNIVSSLWKPSGPLGREDKDYTSRRLYFLNDVDNLHIYTQTPPSLYASANLNLTRYLKKGRYTLILNPDLNEDVSLSLNYYVGKNLVSHKQYKIEAGKKSLSFISDEDGILEVLSTKGVSIEIRDALSNETLHLPALVSGDYYQLDGNTSFQYEFFMPKKRLLRIECRNADLKERTLHINMKDAQGNLVHSLEKSLNFLPSRYDYIQAFMAQSEVSSFYLEVDDDISSIIFDSDEPFLLRVSTKSQNLAYPLYSFSSQERPELERLNGWFSIRPKGFDELKLLQKHSVIYKQVKTPIINASIVEGEYNYEQLEPLKATPSYEFLVPRSLGDKFVRSQSYSSLYSNLQINKVQTLSFKGDTGLNYVKPKLLYYNNTDGNNFVSVNIEGIVAIDKKVSSTSGLIKLPEFELNKRYHVKANSRENIDMYISNTKNISELYAKRKFNVFTSPMQFKFNKTAEEETLGFQLVLNRSLGDEALSFKVKIEGKRDEKSLIYNSVTFKNYKLSMDISKEPINSIGSGKKDLFLSDPIYIGLGDDLEKSFYTLTIYPPDNITKSYVFINHIRLNERASTRFSKEIL